MHGLCMSIPGLQIRYVCREKENNKVYVHPSSSPPLYRLYVSEQTAKLVLCGMSTYCDMIRLHVLAIKNKFGYTEYLLLLIVYLKRKSWISAFRSVSSSKNVI